MDKDSLPINKDYKLIAPNESDYEELLSWSTSSKSLTYWAGPSVDFMQPVQNIIKQINKSTYHSYLLCIDNNAPAKSILGFGQYQYVGDKLHLARLVVNPKYRRQGLSNVLIRLLYNNASKRRTINTLTLFVYKSNKPAISAYIKLGFKNTTIPNTIKVPSDCELLMLNNLSDVNWLSANIGS